MPRIAAIAAGRGVEAPALDGAALFDPMGDGRARSDKVMLPEDVFHDPDELRQWIARAFDHCAARPAKTKAATRTPAAAAKSAAKATRTPAAAAKSAARSAKPPAKTGKRTSSASKPAARRASRGRT